MKIIFKILILLIIFCSCDKDDPTDKNNPTNNKLVEEYTYNPYGVVFKIENDIANRAAKLCTTAL